MADHHQMVCCMCGDVGFPDKLFPCTRCCYRFQHSYCSNFYREASEPVEVCDWCKSEGRNSSTGSSSKKSVAGSSNAGGFTNRSERDMDNNMSTVKARKIPSPRTTARRYKLLKDVMC